MAGRKIKGITLEIGGDTSGLQKALAGVNNEIKSTQSQLKDVERLLKLDPSNSVLLAQKQALLTEAVAETSQKLKELEKAQDQVNAAMQEGKIGQEQYMTFQREMEETRAALGRYQTALNGMSAEQDRLSTNTDRLNKLFDATGTSVDDYADILGSRMVTAIQNGSASADQLKLAIEKVGKAATGGKADINQITEALDETDDGQALQNLIQDLKNVGDQADTTSEQLEGIGNTLTGGAMMQAADQLQSVSDKITEIGSNAKDAFTDAQDATVKASAYFGETGEAAEQTADVIKNVYSQGVGDSMDSVSDAVITVKKNIKDLDQEKLTNLTEQAMTLEELYGVDMNETMRGINALMVNFGMDAQEAMDYVVKGTQNGLDKTNELGDNLSEYSGKFAEAGYSAQEYFQLLNNGLEGGAYNLDKVNDAINVVTTRLADGTIAESIGSYSEETQNLFKAWQDGEATQKDVINSIVKDIGKCTNQQEALNLAATAFGTMAEDGSAKFITSLTTMGETYDSVSGSAQNMYDSSTTESQKFEAALRQLQMSLAPLGEALLSLANNILPPIASAISKVAEFFGKLPGPVKNFVVILGTLLTVFTALTPVILGVAGAVTALQVPLLPIIGIIAAVAAAITGIIAIIQNWGSITEWLGTIWQAIKDKCIEVWTAICNFFTVTIPEAWNSLMEKFQAIPEWWAGIWTQVQTFFTNTWNAMMQNPVVQTIVTTIQTLFQGLSTTLQGIWNGLVQIASGIWELLKNTILAPVILLKDLVTGDFTQLSEDSSRIWENIKDAAGRIWEGIKTVIGSLVEGLVGGIKTLFEGLRDTMGEIWDNISGKTSEIWENIKGFVTEKAGELKDKAIEKVSDLKEKIYGKWEEIKKNATDTWENVKTAVIERAKGMKEDAVKTFENVVTGIRRALSGVKETVQNGLSGAVGYIKGLAGDAWNWGADMMNGLANGIASGVQWVTDKVISISNTIASWLHFSRPDKGPLHYYEEWMPDFMQGLADGIERSKGVVTDALKNLQTNMVLSPETLVATTPQIQKGDINGIAALLKQCAELLANGNDIYFDDGTWAGRLTPKVNAELGRISDREARR